MHVLYAQAFIGFRLVVLYRFLLLLIVERFPDHQSAVGIDLLAKTQHRVGRRRRDSTANDGSGDAIVENRCGPSLPGTRVFRTDNATITDLASGKRLSAHGVDRVVGGDLLHYHTVIDENCVGGNHCNRKIDREMLDYLPALEEMESVDNYLGYQCTDMYHHPGLSASHRVLLVKAKVTVNAASGEAEIEELHQAISGPVIEDLDEVDHSHDYIEHKDA